MGSLRARAASATLLGLLGLAAASCKERDVPVPSSGRFASDLAFLRAHTEVILLADAAGQGFVAVAPSYQGRVMTSTTGGNDAPSFGWIGRDAIAAGVRQPHMNVFGGEDRFWLGPEGGQYALYFKSNDPFDLDHWQVPEPFDWGAWDVTERSPTMVRFRKRMSLVNYAGSQLTLEVDRTVRLLTAPEMATALGQTPGGGLQAVGFESSNTITNAGAASWQPQSGLVSIWILGMFAPSSRTTIAVPFVQGPDATLGRTVNDSYFGNVPPDRLIVKDGVVFFRGDGQYRSKIGFSPARALNVAGSYDASGRVLTLVQYTRPPDAHEYVNSMWEIQREPYKGDVVNSYNDGPVAPGKPPLGPFYELESSSPALSLSPGQHYTHVHRTFHFAGPEAELDRLARATLTVGIGTLSTAFDAVPAPAVR